MIYEGIFSDDYKVISSDFSDLLSRYSIAKTPCFVRVWSEGKIVEVFHMVKFR
jgi:hypothetical protein